MPNSSLRRFLLTGYGLPHAMGYIPLRDGRVNPQPWTASELVVRAEQLGLGGIEIPLAAQVPSFEGRTVELEQVSEALADELRSRDMQLVADFGVVVEHSVDEWHAYLLMAHRLGARIVRAIISNLLCGDRRPLTEGWNVRLEETARRLTEVLPFAESLGMCVAIENHQDASTDDLLRLDDLVHHHPSFGVTLDTGNPLATGQHPVMACQQLLPILRHIHLKDYTMYLTTTGYRLVRCPAGQGVVDFPAILEVLQASPHHLRPGIEIAAQAARSIPLLDIDWWTTYPPRDARELVPTWELLWRQARGAHQPHETLWERGAASAEVIADEWRTVRQSVAFFGGLAAS